MRRLEMILSRLAWFVPTLAGLVIIVFLISHVIPTDPVRVLLGENATPAQIEAMRIKLGYDQPLWSSSRGTSATPVGQSRHQHLQPAPDIGGPGARACRPPWS